MRYRAVLAAGLVASSLLVAQPAQAADGAVQSRPKCSFDVPYKLVLSSRYSPVTFELGGNCPKTFDHGTWNGVADGGSGWYLVGCAQPCFFFASEFNLGLTVKWIPQGHGYDIKGHIVADLLPGVSMTKAASFPSVTGTRKGVTTNLTVATTYFNARRMRKLPWPNRVLLQYRNPGRTTTWSTLAYVTPNASGVAKYTLTTNRSRAYRAFVPSTPTVWYSYSPAVTV
ncbi:hypothetical protein [Kribbella sp. NPDC055071]